MEDRIKEYYSEYKRFMNENCLPEINPIFNINNRINENILAYVNIDEMDKLEIPIYIDTKIFLYDENYLKSILFHEFTHIFDKVITFCPPTINIVNAHFLHIIILPK